MKELATKLYAPVGLIMILLVCAAGIASGQSQTDTLYVQNETLDQHKKPAVVPLSKVLEDIERTYHIRFLYQSDLIEGKTVSKAVLTSAKLARKLGKLLVNNGLTYEKQGNSTYIIKRLAGFQDIARLVSAAQITGTVTDEQTGNTLPGVNILVKGTSTGTSTDSEGNFELTVESLQDTLVVSFIGYQTQNVPIEGRRKISIEMQSQAITGEEMVVVGYGTQQEVNVTGSVSSIDYEENLANRPITNSSQALGGNASGVWVSQNSGKPGSDAAQIRIRGWGTMNNADPLVIIDGVEGSFDQINSEDIESISVLKDAASAAIYGSKAANGVVLITTKSGQFDEDLEVNISSYAGVQQLGRHYNMITNSAEYMGLWNQALATEGVDPRYPDNLIADFRGNNNEYKYPNTDWFDQVYQTAPIQKHNISISGGSSQISAFLSLNYLNQEGIIKNTGSDEYGLRANVQSKPTEWLDLGVRLNYQKEDSNEPYRMDNRVFTRFTTTAPFIAPYTQDDRFGSVEAIDDEGALLFDNWNPMMSIYNGGNEVENEITNLNVNAQITLTDNLNLQTTFATKSTYNLSSQWNEQVLSYTSTGVEGALRNREGIERMRNNSKRIDNSIYTTVNYSESFGQLHNLTALAGIEYRNNTIKNVRAYAMDPVKDNLTQVDAGTSGKQANGNLLGVRTFSYFTRINYSLANKYLFEANIRRDASSRFQEGNRWGTFPGFSAGWRISEEEFMNNVGFISNLKLRASWGRLGNQNITGYWPYLTIINQNDNLSYSYNESFEPGLAVTSLVDENITWESATTMDIGLDVGLLDNKINIEATYFNKITEDIIVQLPIPQTLGGVSPPVENEGEMENNGVEFVLSYDKPAEGRDNVGFSINANLTYTQNEVTKFRGGNSPDQKYLIREGYSYQSLYGFKVEGIYQSDQEAAQHMTNNSFMPKAGNLKYEDRNNDGRLNFQDKQVLGSTIPKWTVGLSPSFNFKGFDLEILFQGLADLTVDTQNGYTLINNNNPLMHSMWKNAWTPQNTDTRIPSIKLNNSWDQRTSDFWMYDISYVKLKNVQLGYTIPVDITSRLGLQNIYIYANGQNLFSIVNDDYPGFDPERNTFGAGQNIYPTPRILTLGLNLKF